MALSALDITRQEALEAAGLVCLPDALNQSANIVWVKAIGLVRKLNGIKNYVLLEQNDEGKAVIKKDFGALAQILEIEEIYPYEFLERRFLPRLTSDEDTIKFLKKHLNNEAEVSLLLNNSGKTAEQIRSDRKKVRQMVLSVSMAYAKQTLNDELKYKQMFEKAQEDGTEENKETAAYTQRPTKRGRKSNHLK
jgi:hypothetical protein